MSYQQGLLLTYDTVLTIIKIYLHKATISRAETFEQDTHRLTIALNPVALLQLPQRIPKLYY